MPEESSFSPPYVYKWMGFLTGTAHKRTGGDYFSPREFSNASPGILVEPGLDF